MSIKIQEHLQNQLNLFHSQQDMAVKYKTSAAMISNYVKGKVKHPSLDFARKVYQIDKVVLYPYSEEAVSNED